MKLKKIRVTNYKSCVDSDEFLVGDITCLVGKNEAGKTALLEAVYKLNPVLDSEGNYDVTEEYPRSEVSEYELAIHKGEKKHATVITVFFELDEEEIESVEDNYEKGILLSSELIISKGYDNKKNITLMIDEKKMVNKMTKDASLSDPVRDKAIACTDLNKLSSVLQEASPDGGVTELLKTVNAILKDGATIYIYNKYLKDWTPKFFYFDEYYQLEGYVNLESLKQRLADNKVRDSDKPMLGLIHLSRLSIDQFLDPKKTQDLTNRLEGASNHITKTILKYWTQNKRLSMKFDVRNGLPEDPQEMRSGHNLLCQVYNERHKASTLLGKRSKGFVWFFSFLAWFSKVKEDGKPLILLLDEPALFLHAKAQYDMLKYMEAELATEYQVVYTTHSPFMVDPNRFDRVRIVEDRSLESDDPLDYTKEGTKVLTEVLEISEDSAFPLQGALGYEIFQTLFIGPNCLVVEGVSDLLYLQTINGILERKNKVGLDKRWTITPVGGSDKVPTFVALIGAQTRLKVATLIDIQSKYRQSIENLYKKKLLKKKNVLTFADFTKKDESDIEDMFEVPFYLMLVNKEFEKELTKPIEDSGLPKRKDRILTRLDVHFEQSPLKRGKFNHYRPARYFMENVNALECHISESVLQRFEDAFIQLNSLLSKSAD